MKNKRSDNLINRRRLIVMPVALCLLAVLLTGGAGLLIGRHMMLTQIRRDGLNLAGQIEEQILQNAAAAAKVRSLLEAHIQTANRLVASEAASLSDAWLDQVVDSTPVDSITVFGPDYRPLFASHKARRPVVAADQSLRRFMESANTEMVEDPRTDIITGATFLFGTMKLPCGAVTQSGIGAAALLDLVGPFGYQTLTRRLMEKHGILHARVVDRNRLVVADANVTGIGLRRDMDERPLWREAFEGTISTDFGFDADRNMRILNVVIPIRSDAAVTHVLEFGLSLDQMNRHLRRMFLMFFAVIGCVLVAMLWLLYKSIIIPVRELDCGIRAIDLERGMSDRIDLSPRNPFLGLAANLNAILDKTQGYFEDLRQKQIAIAESEARYRMLFENMNAGFALHEVVYDEKGRAGDYRFLEMNPMFEQLTGNKADEYVGRTTRELKPDDSEQYWIEIYGRVAQTGVPVSLLHYSEEVGKYFELYAFSPAKDQFAVFFVDVTERKKAEQERETLQNQFSQMQKLDSIGRLAGGVAHDFNNMLSVIIGHSELMLEEMGPDHPLRADLNEMYKAARHSSELTRQLLAFARKQAVEPRVLDINETVEGMLKMIRRLIGEDIHLEWKPGSSLWAVRIDPSQMDQILANLCVNARDAMPQGGTITIRTENAFVDEEQCTRHADYVAGEFVRLEIGDDGCGMDAETLKHLFEPFYTTKQAGQGTGLGLATVYGVVKQNEGFVSVYSEPGQGSVFRIHFPRHMDAQARPPEEPRAQPAARGSETILLVEDDPAILRMTARILNGLGYTVLTAGAPEDAIGIAEAQSGGIHLLMTDVVMPQMNGRDLAERLRHSHPDIKRLFMSGYTADIIAHHGVLDEGVYFIQKPFVLKDLAFKIRDALGGATSGP